MNPNWWLVLLAFVLGIVFTLLWSLRRVKRRVAETSTEVRSVAADDSALAAGVAVPAASASLVGAAASADGDADADTNDPSWPEASGEAAALVGGGSAAVGHASAVSATAGGGAVAAAAALGDIKGNKDSMLYHTTDSPWYGRTKAEEWFTTESQAQAAGYTRWDHGRAKAGATSAIAVAETASASTATPTADAATPKAGTAKASAATPKADAGTAKDVTSAPKAAATKAAASKATSPAAGKGAPKAAAPSASATPKASAAMSKAATTETAAGTAGDIKGNGASMLYHTTDSPWYGRTTPEEWFATEAEAQAAGYTRWDHGRVKAPAKSNTGAAKPKATSAATKAASKPAPAAKPKATVAVTKPAAKSAAAPKAAAGGTGDIKGNRDSMLYHTTDSPWYGRTKAEEWFATEAEAQAAGYIRWDHKRTQR